MKTLCLYGRDNTSRCALGAAFDLQLFSESQQALVHTVDGKVTLDFTRSVIMLSYDVVDEDGRIYGTGHYSDVTLVSPPEGTPPIEAVVYSVENVGSIFNSKYLGETVTCKAIEKDSGKVGSITFLYGETNSDKSVSVRVAPGQEAEAVYRHDAKGDCWAESFKNGQINISNGSYAVLPDGAEVVAPHEGAGSLTADSDGNITVCGQVYLKSGVFHLSNNTLTGYSGVVLYDASGKYWATLPRDKKHPNSAVYDAGTRTFSSVQGRIWLTVAEGEEESAIRSRIYKP